MISLSDVVVTPTIFPDKTSQVWKLPEDLLAGVWKEDEAHVAWEFEHEGEIAHLAQLKILLDTYTAHVHLWMPYLPYARQDKRVENSSTFALTAFATLLNAIRFASVTVLDSHNNPRAHAIYGLEDLRPKKYIEKAFEDSGANLILFPDAGAWQRYGAYQIGPAISADKIREQSTGRILGITINGKVKDKKLLIVDDLCDAGGTFKLVAEQAIKAGAKDVHLYVTHGLFTKGLQTLRDSGIHRIFTRQGEVK